MMEYLHLFIQTSLDAVTMYIICSFVAFRGIKWNKPGYIWLLLFFIFCIVSRFTFIVSETVDFLGINFENYELLPVNSWIMLIFLFFIVLILNSSLFETGDIDTIYITVLSFMIWIILRLISVLVVGLFIQNTLIDRILTLIFVLLLISSPIQPILNAIKARNFYTKIMLLNSFFVLILILILTNFNQELVLKHAWMVLFTLSFIISLNLWILNEQRKKLTEEKRLTVIEQYLPVIDDLVTEMRVKQHEFNNRLLAISSIVETEQDVQLIREKVREYTEYALPKLSTQQLLSVNHKVIAGFLYSKIKLAEWKKIKITTEIQTDFKGFQSNEFDWIEALGILLDNALEATLPSEEIRVTMKKCDEMLELCVSNPSAYITNTEFMNMFEQGYTTKSNQSKSRGYGLLALKQITEQYHGKIITKNEEYHGNNYVTIGVLLP